MGKSIISTVCLLILIFSVHSGSSDPIKNADFENLTNAQNAEFQKELRNIFPESKGFMVSGPLCHYDFSDSIKFQCGKIRVICADAYVFDEGLKMAESDKRFSLYDTRYPFEKFFEFKDSDIVDTFKLETFQSVRYDIYIHSIEGPLDAEDNFNPQRDGPDDGERMEMWQYFVQIDSGRVPAVSDLDAAVLDALYPPPPPYIIEGYQNYKDYLYSYSEIRSDFIQGVTAFIPTPGTLQWFKDNAPEQGFPNKEAAIVQREFQDFFDRGGDIRVIHTLTRESFDSLESGEYFFAVNPAYIIRFGKEIDRTEVARIESETGKKVPRANHAFLFPGECILAAGAFFIDSNREVKLVKVNAQSGHYFYSNLNESIKEDISEGSDHYLLTLGHFFKALDILGIPYQNIMISKL
jgi:hypothetical protein